MLSAIAKDDFTKDTIIPSVRKHDFKRQADVLEQSILVRRGLNSHTGHKSADRQVIQLRNHGDSPTLGEQSMCQLAHGAHGLHAACLLYLVDFEHVVQIDVDILVGAFVLSRTEGHCLPSRSSSAQFLSATSCNPFFHLRTDSIDSHSMFVRFARIKDDGK